MVLSADCLARVVLERVVVRGRSHATRSEPMGTGGGGGETHYENARMYVSGI